MSGWNGKKVEAFESAFFDFLNNVNFYSKDIVGASCLGEHVYTAQRFFLDAVFSALRDDVHDIKILKSRQLGMSTICRALSLFWLGVHEGLPGAIVFESDTNKNKSRREIVTMINGLPKSLKFPRIRADNREGLTLENDSTAQFLAAGTRASRQGGGLGRSSGLSFLHASEICSWENPEGIVSLQQSLTDVNPNRLFIYESTARGMNSWQEMWDEAKKDTLGQRTCFIGWWAKESQQIFRGTPYFEKYGTAPPTPDEIKKIDAVRRQYNFAINQEQLAWIRRKCDPTLDDTDADREGDDYLQAEQAWTEEEAFILSGSTFFPADRLTEIRSKQTSNKYSSHRYYPGTDFVTCEVYPARNHRETQLKVWEEPIDDAVYIISADPAFGGDEKNDRSAAQVFRCYADAIEQVAEFADPLTPTNHFAWILWSLCGWYGAGRSGQSKNPVYFVVEINGPGDAVWREFKSVPSIVKNGYLRKEAQEKGLRDIFNNVRNYVYTRSDSMQSGSSYQFKTSAQLKVSIMEQLRNFIIDGTLIIRSQDTLDEMRAVTRTGDQIRAEGRKKDDRVISMAMGTHYWSDRVRKTLITQNRTMAADKAKRARSILDQYEIFTQNTLTDFLKSKSRARMAVQREQQRNSWRYR